MKKRYFLNSIFFIIFLLFNLSAFTQTEIMTPTYPVVKKSIIKEYQLKEGVHDLSLEMDNGKSWEMQLSIPKMKEGEEVPLVIALHWAGGGKTYKEFSDCLAFPALDFMNAIIVAPSAEGGRWIDDNNEKRVMHLIKLITKHWPVDDQKIILTGYSNGGIGTWYLAQKYPKIFAAGLPIAGFYHPEKVKVPLYILHGEADELFKWREVDLAITSAINFGSPIKYKSIPEFTHYMACSYTDELKAMAKMMVKELGE